MNRRYFLFGTLLPVLASCGKSAGSSDAPLATPNNDLAVAAPPVDTTAILAATPAPQVAGSQISAVPKPAVAYYTYSGDAVTAVANFAAATSVAVTTVPDRLNAAYANQFAGDSSQFVVPGLPALDVQAFAISAWVNASASSVMTVLTVLDGSQEVLSIVSDTASGVVLAGSIVGAASASGQHAIGVADGQWHHVLVQGTQGGLSLFVDGFAARSYARAGATQVVGAPALSVGPWLGSVDDVRSYDRSFDPASIPLLAFRWVQVTPAAPYLQRDGAGLVSFNEQLWLLGGWNPDYSPVTNSEVWSSPDGINWTLQTTAPWSGRHCAGWAVYDNQIWVAGGDNLSGSYENDVWSSPDGVNWTEHTASPPWAGRDLTMVVPFAGELWLMGGCKVFESSGNVAYNDVYATTDGKTWVEKQSAAAWSPRGIMLGHAEFGNRIWVIGGGTYDIRTFNNDVWSSSDGVNWEAAIESAPWAARQYHSVAVSGGKIWVMAGTTADIDGGTTDCWYSTNGSMWVQLPGTPWPARHASSVCTHNGVLWLTCGSDTQLYNDVWQLNFAP